MEMIEIIKQVHRELSSFEQLARNKEANITSLF